MRKLLSKLPGASAALALAAFSPLARAAEEHPHGFEKGTWTFQSYGGYFNDLGPYDVEGGFGSAGVSYYFVDGMSVGAEVTGYGISQPVNNAAAGSVGLVFRHHLFDSGNSSLFVDVTGAAFEATDNVPHEGTQFNFFTTLGLGLTQNLGGGTHLMFGARYFHVSNANLFGDDKNPALNGISFYAGLMFKL